MSKLISKSMLVLSLFSVTGCANFDPYNSGDRALVGAGVGGVSGAAIGGLATRSPGGALVGGALGAATGAVIGATTTPPTNYSGDYYHSYYRNFYNNYQTVLPQPHYAYQYGLENDLHHARPQCIREGYDLQGDVVCVRWVESYGYGRYYP